MNKALKIEGRLHRKLVRIFSINKTEYFSCSWWLVTFEDFPLPFAIKLAQNEPPEINIIDFPSPLSIHTNIHKLNWTLSIHKFFAFISYFTCLLRFKTICRRRHGSSIKKWFVAFENFSDWIHHETNDTMNTNNVWRLWCLTEQSEHNTRKN